VAYSETYVWSPDLAECVDDAFERCGVDPSTLDVSHMRSARRSINFMLVDWSAEERHDFRVDRLEISLTQGAHPGLIDPDTDGRIIDVLQVALRRDGVDTGIYPMSRSEWLDIPDKSIEGRPNRYFADKEADGVYVYLWTLPENSTDTLVMDTMRKFKDAGGNAHEPDIPYYMRDAFAAGLAARLAIKFSPDRVGMLEQLAERSLNRANASQRTLGDVVIVPSSNYRRRHGYRRR
jgi:hypothetical protein